MPVLTCLYFTYPRARGGDPAVVIEGNPLLTLIPAHAGVIPSTRCWPMMWSAYPRARGGDPYTMLDNLKLGYLSPRTRG